MTLAGFLSLLILIVGIVNGGVARFEFFPNVPGDNIKADLTLQDGASSSSLLESITVVEDAIFKVDEDFRSANPKSDGLIKHVGFFVDSDSSANFRVELVKAENRTLTAVEIAELWRDEVGLMPNVKTQKFSADQGPGDANMALSLSGKNPEELTLAGIELKEYLTQYDGVFDLSLIHI